MNEPAKEGDILVKKRTKGKHHRALVKLARLCYGCSPFYQSCLL
jgi:hypothetical protein